MKVFVRVSEGIADTGGGACVQSSINSFVFSITTLQPPKTAHWRQGAQWKHVSAELDQPPQSLSFALDHPSVTFISTTFNQCCWESDPMLIWKGEEVWVFLSRNDLRSSARRWLEGGVAIISQGVPIHGAIAGERMGEGGLGLLPHLKLSSVSDK